MDEDNRLRARIIDIDAGRPIILLHERDSERLSIHMGDRAYICKKGGRCGRVGIVDVTDTMVGEGEVGLFNDLAGPMRLYPSSIIRVMPREKPESVAHIKKKITGCELSEYEINSVIKDIVGENLSDIELTSFVTASAIHGFTRNETVALTLAMINTGDRLDFDGTVVDKHCIGGVPGNRTTMVVVPMLASLGLKIPKTSSRAITSPSGTADTMEVLANVSFDAAHVKRFVNEIGACIVWGGAINLAPADDKIIRIEYPLSIDAEGQVLASIISKKKSVGSDYVILDIPYGNGAKIKDRKSAKALGEKFTDLASEVNMSLKYVMTDGTQPIGNGIGPVLEAMDVLLALEGDGPKDLVKKGIFLVSELMEFSGATTLGEGKKEAKRCLEDCSALEKMREIIKIQGGNPKVTPKELKPGKFKKTFFTETGGKVVGIDNFSIAQIARSAGAPRDRGAGVFINQKVGDKVSARDPLFTVYAESNAKLRYAAKIAERGAPFSLK